ncbi:long-chain fatty acid--CoA ligase [Actinomycetospora sp. TBRC 11914]|uniref:AMP-dependent synthetase/ligase n=1 Tax=Actinomycetospora sp. TBRC 11914 TaxID=2729387 RepID=UPI00145F2451|nr:AMP-dependent synthetase/ligase [Actinomycetospora sp. TBRC 11914]NMO91661.1 long-chain fatty acid--CoA ligase [Actinomycetospora sp. TBRC 11914]
MTTPVTDSVTPRGSSPDAGDEPVDADTVCEAFRRVVVRCPDGIALRTGDDSVRYTWAEFDLRMRSVAAGLAALGLGHGDTLGMLLPNLPEVHLVDFAAVHLGAVPFAIFNSSSAEQIAEQLTIADCRVVVTGRSFLPTVRDAVMRLDHSVDHLVTIDGGADELTLADVESRADPDFDLDARSRLVGAEDLVTMIFTSGTTGPPKAAQWSHRTVMAQQRALDAALPLPSQGILSFLPMAHAGGRITSHYMALPYGATITTCPDMREVPTYLGQVHPDAFFSVPRLWEKLQVALEGMIDKADLRSALETNLHKVRADDGGSDVPAGEADALGEVFAANLDAFRPLVARLGLDRIKAAFVGGAPCAGEVIQFFRAVGVPLLEAYGSTETSLNVFNRVEDFKSGTAGRPLPGVEVRLLDDGELLCRAPLNMVGYRKDPEKTAETLDDEGWLHTGDIAVIDDEGYVSIVDRKKELIINAAGKNMSPANIESAIKGESSLIGQIVTIGDGRRYNTALITLDPEAAPQYAERLGLTVAEFSELAAHPRMHEEIDRAVQRGNARLNSNEQIKKYRILPDVWQPDSDELTPTAKLKRRPIAAKYASQIEELYAE